MNLNNIKRRLTLRQKGQRKHFYIKKKSWFSLGKNRKDYRFFDNEGFEIYDPMFLDIIFTQWWDIYDTIGDYACESDLDESDYILDYDDEVETTEKMIEEVDIVEEPVIVEAKSFEPLDDVTDHLEEEQYVEPERYVEPEPTHEDTSRRDYYDSGSYDSSDSSDSYDSGGSDSGGSDD